MRPRSTYSATRFTTDRESSRASAHIRPQRGVAVFRLTDHIERLFNSAKILMIDTPWTVADLVEAAKAVVRESG